MLHASHVMELQVYARIWNLGTILEQTSSFPGLWALQANNYNRKKILKLIILEQKNLIVGFVKKKAETST